MATTPRGITWEKLEPIIEPSDLTAEGRAGNMVASAAFGPLLTPTKEIGLLAIKLAFENGETKIVFLDRFAAALVKGAIDDLDRVQWKPIPDPTGLPH